MRRPCLCRKITVPAIIFFVGCGLFLAEPTAIAIASIPAMNTDTATGIASYYSYECASKPMANGKAFDPEKRTCASWFHRFGTVLVVKSLDTGRSTEVVVTDRGPNMRLVRQGRIIDLSKRAFEDICDLRQGLTKVSITVKSED